MPTNNMKTRWQAERDHAGVRASVQDRTGCCDIPDIIWPVSKERLPLISTVKFGDPFVRTAVAVSCALCPVREPEKTTESRYLKLSVKIHNCRESRGERGRGRGDRCRDPDQAADRQAREPR